MYISYSWDFERLYQSLQNEIAGTHLSFVSIHHVGATI